MIAVSLEAVSSSPMLSLLSIVVIVQSPSRVQLFAIPWTATCQASLSSTMSWSLLKLMSIELMDTIHPSHPLLSPFLPALNLSQHQGLFYWVGFSRQVGKVLEPQFQHQSFQ